MVSDIFVLILQKHLNEDRFEVYSGSEKLFTEDFMHMASNIPNSNKTVRVLAAGQFCIFGSGGSLHLFQALSEILCEFKEFLSVAESSLRDLYSAQHPRKFSESFFSVKRHK